MARRLEVLPDAEHEVVSAARWYFERSPTAAAAFEAEIDRAFLEILRAPEIWPRHHHGTQRFLLSRFPYEVVFRLYPEIVLVIAVAHSKRKPRYWQSRTN